MLLVLSLGMCVAGCNVRAYFAKPWPYHVLDALIVSSPLNLLIGFVLWFAPEWHRRPEDWRSGKYRSPVRRRLRRMFITRVTFFGLAVLGVVTYCLHITDLIPKIR